jgi:hypothetical protein
MRFKPKSTAALHIALGGLPDKMRVESDSDVGVSRQNRRRASEGDGVARQFGDYDPAGTLSRKRR